MPAHSSVVKVMRGTTFRRLATKPGEKCGLAFTDLLGKQAQNFEHHRYRNESRVA